MPEKIVGYVLIITDVGKEHDVATTIKRKFSGEVTEAVLTYGIYDIVVRFEVDSFMKSNEIVSFIREVPGVRKTETLIGFPVES
ncbi:MAG: Lrp/AsnC ligand binding domain-containing protein [Desulfurococcales archaeon]|nr:Lrp/AsnC ligand binding domain-containing protein [Desulfurococcales archaeon]